MVLQTKTISATKSRFYILPILRFLGSDSRQAKVVNAGLVCAKCEFAMVQDSAWEIACRFVGCESVKINRVRFDHAPFDHARGTFTQQKVTKMTCRFIPAVLMLLCVVANGILNTAHAQQQPLSNGPLQPTVIGQAGQAAVDSSDNSTPVTNFTPNPGLPAAGQGFPADFRAVSRSGDASDLTNPNATASNPTTLNQTSNPLDARHVPPNQVGSDASGLDFNSISNGPVAASQWNTAGGSATPFAPVSNGLQSGQDSANGIGTEPADDHPNHDPAFHVDNESQIDRANRTDGTGLSVGPIRNPAISPLFGQSSPGQEEVTAGQNSGLGSNVQSLQTQHSQSMQPIQPRTGSQSVQADRNWQLDGQSSASANPGQGSQDTFGNPAANPNTPSSTGEIGGNAMQRMLGQSNSQPANSNTADQAAGNVGVDPSGSASGYRTAFPVQDPNGLQQPPRLGGNGSDAVNNNWMNRNGFGGSGNFNGTGNTNTGGANGQGTTGMFDNSGQLASDRSPVVTGGRGDFVTGNPMLPRDQAVDASNGNDAFQRQAATATNKQIINATDPRVRVDMQLAGASGAFLGPQGGRQETRKLNSDPGNGIQGDRNAGTPVTPTTNSETDVEGGVGKELDKSLKEGWLLFFFVSVGLNCILIYLLIETRNNYRDLADELQDRFFRESNT